VFAASPTAKGENGKHFTRHAKACKYRKFALANSAQLAASLQTANFRYLQAQLAVCTMYASKLLLFASYLQRLLTVCKQFAGFVTKCTDVGKLVCTLVNSESSLFTRTGRRYLQMAELPANCKEA
jgi:hypothetical protein